MKTSEDTTLLMTAMSKAQGEFTNVKAEAVNPFHKSKYADLASVTKMLRPVLAKNDLVVNHGITHLFTDAKIQACLTTRLSHKSGQWIEDDGMPLLVSTKDKNGNEVEATMQKIMAAQTYAKRAGLMALCQISATEGEDDDGTAASTVKEWHGPLKKHALSDAARKMSTAITKAATLDQLHEVQIEYMPIIDQLRADLPTWYDGNPEKDAIGVREAIENRRQQLTEETLPSEDDEPIVGAV